MGGDDRPRAGLRPTYADQRRVAAPRDQGPFLPAPAEGRLVPQHELGAARAGRPSYLPGRAADRTGSKARPAAMRLCPRARRHRPVHVLQPGGRPLPAQQLRAASLPPCLRRAVPASERQARQAGRRGRHSMAGHPGRVVAAGGTREAIRSPVRPGHHPVWSARTARDAAHPAGTRSGCASTEGPSPTRRRSALPRQRRAARRRRSAGLLAAGQGRADAARPAAQPQDVDGRGRHSRDPGRAAAGPPGSRDARPVRPRLAADAGRSDRSPSGPLGKIAAGARQPSTRTPPSRFSTTCSRRSAPDQPGRTRSPKFLPIRQQLPSSA